MSGLSDMYLFKKKHHTHKNPGSSQKSPLTSSCCIYRGALGWQIGKTPDFIALSTREGISPGFYNPCLCQPNGKEQCHLYLKAS